VNVNEPVNDPGVSSPLGIPFAGIMKWMRKPVAFIGSSDSGKTTLLVALVRRLSRAGERVAVIKHTHHDPSKRKPRGDTERFLEAGAVQVVLAGKTEAVLMNGGDSPTLRSFATARDLPTWLDADRILIEGFKSLDLWPRVLVERSGGERVRPLPSVAAVVTDSSERFDVPSFRHDDLDGLIAFLDRIAAT
jgi:molybdopterin-guanine dinucleotide biosynthesis protein B